VAIQRDNPTSTQNTSEGGNEGCAEPNAEQLTAQVAEMLPLLDYLAGDLRRLAVLDEALRVRLSTVAGALSRPDRYTRRALSKEITRQRVAKVRDHDQATLAQTGIRTLRKEAVFQTPLPMPGAALDADILSPSVDSSADPWAAAEADRFTGGDVAGRVHVARICYVCKAEYFDIHKFYDQMCATCADFNWHKRNLTADLRGRVALVTGARVKIGYQAAIKLLRAGAEVIVVTRFPVDAAARYGREIDVEQWRDRLHIYGVDLRHTPSVEALCQHLLTTLSRLDVLINNACQTVRRPSGFYDHLLVDEMNAMAALPAIARGFVQRHAEFRLGGATSMLQQPSAMWQSAALSQVALLDEDAKRGDHLFPLGKLDADLQQIDLRSFNSWRMTLTDVPTAELLEVQLVNAIAPFIMNARLKPLLAKVASQDTHIVNVSAMEGQFYRRWKTDKHPHTNMAKAALNMMTRTSAADYRRSGIHMNSVDTGWVSDEDPAALAARKLEMHHFHPPLDIVDGAARIVDPFVDGIHSGRHTWGVFIKDYRPAPW
jgi:NAD(P)-dependent dehydrogenase (short-subunit alcohol dehydrogenase family)